MHHLSALRTLVCSIAVLVFPILANGATYTFEGLTSGNLAGQDGWFLLNGSQTSYTITTGTGFDVTNVARNPGIAASGDDVHFVGRTNDGNFSYGDLSSATNLTIAFDVQVQNIGSQDQFIAFNLINPAHDTYASPAISYRQQFGAAPVWGYGAAAYTGSPGGGSSGAIPGTLNTNDWIRLELVMDLTANGGQGTGDIYVTNLTQIGSAQLVASGLNLALSPSLSKGIWDTMWLRSDFGSSVTFDNLTVSPTFAAIPEINGIWIAGGCALLLGGHFVRRRRQTVRI